VTLLAKATLLRELAAGTVSRGAFDGGAGDRSGTVDGDLVPSAEMLILGKTSASLDCEAASLADVLVEAATVDCEILERLLSLLSGPNISASRRRASSDGVSVLLSAIFDDNEDVSNEEAGLGGTFESNILSE
jgi:hypothetical protein